MIPARIIGCTRVLGKSQGYLGLPVRDVVYSDGDPAIQSAWIPDPKELEAIANGAPVILTLMGTGHPPVLLSVGEVPK